MLITAPLGFVQAGHLHFTAPMIRRITRTPARPVARPLVSAPAGEVNESEGEPGEAEADDLGEDEPLPDGGA
jgi:hypothetical protein